MVLCSQTYELIKGIQKKAAEQCAPVIFDIKPSNLLIIDQCYAKALKFLVETTGLKARCFDHRSSKQVWFMFREEALEQQLADPDNRAFMNQFGYSSEMTMDEVLAFAAKRFRDYKRGEGEFPHELGILLGYPLGDVKGFIEHHGRDYLYTGYWKVYENEDEARETFRRYASAKKIATEMVNQGVGIGMVEQYQVI